MVDIIFKELVAVKTNDEWFYIINESITNGQPTTIENIKTIINNEFSSLGLITTHETENEIYIVTNQPIK
jgi:hypothetical protein